MHIDADECSGPREWMPGIGFILLNFDVLLVLTEI